MEVGQGPNVGCSAKGKKKSVPLIPYRVEVVFYILIVLQILGLLGRVISSSQGRYLHTGQHKTE
jgi:hypothetical protein